MHTSLGAKKLSEAWKVFKIQLDRWMTSARVERASMTIKIGAFPLLHSRHAIESYIVKLRHSTGDWELRIEIRWIGMHLPHLHHDAKEFQSRHSPSRSIISSWMPRLLLCRFNFLQLRFDCTIQSQESLRARNNQAADMRRSTCAIWQNSQASKLKTRELIYHTRLKVDHRASLRVQAHTRDIKHSRFRLKRVFVPPRHDKEEKKNAKRARSRKNWFTTAANALFVKTSFDEHRAQLWHLKASRFISGGCLHSKTHLERLSKVQPNEFLIRQMECREGVDEWHCCSRSEPGICFLCPEIIIIIWKRILMDFVWFHDWLILSI